MLRADEPFSQPPVRAEAIAVMKEVGTDITSHRSKNVDEFAGQDFDYVLTVCDNAKETCPVFFGKATRLHHSTIRLPLRAPRKNGLTSFGGCGTNYGRT